MQHLFFVKYFQSTSKHLKIGLNLHTNVRLNKKTKIEHNKFAVFDNKSVVTGSYNWTNPASKSNSENCVFFDQPHKEFSNRFAYLWKLYEPVED